jgi:hypothetical protein
MEQSVYNNIAQLENGTATDKIIRLKSVYKTGKTTVQPVKDKITGWYKGIPRLSEEEKRKKVYWAEPNSKFVIKDGTTFDLSDEAQKITWEWVKHCPCIADTEEECQFTKEAEFFIYLENKSAAESVSRKERRFKAEKYIIEDNASNYPTRASLLGVQMDGESPMVIKDFLLTQAEQSPDKILAIYEGYDVSLRLLLLKARKNNIITTDSSGLFLYGNTAIGMTETSVISWMQDPKNKHLVEMLEKEVNPEYFVDENEETEVKTEETKSAAKPTKGKVPPQFKKKTSEDK